MARTLSLAAGLCSLALLAACGPEEDDTAPPDDTGDSPVYRDRDGDGVTSETDCDDRDPHVFPGAVDVCDGVDNDCDTDIDEDPDIAWYADADGDGFGDLDQPTGTACEALDGSVANHADCDDGDAAVFPGAAEVCDGDDDDCDGEVDEGAATHVETWGGDSGTGSATDPYGSIQVALDSGSACIAVGPGTYRENLTIAAGPVWLFSTEGSDATVVDGSGQGSVLVVTARSSDEVRVEGLTLTNGYASMGGGLYVYGSTVALDDVQVTYCSADSGGGITVVRGALEATSLGVDSNWAYSGGGLYAENATLALSSSSLSGNTAEYGAGAAVGGGSATFTDVAIDSNQASYSGAGLYAYSADLTFERASVYANKAEQDAGGGLVLYDAQASLTDSSIERNEASYSSAGGVLLYASYVALNGVQISANTAPYGWGGGILAQYGSTLEIAEVTLEGNSAWYGSGGGLYAYSSTYVGGSGLYLLGNEVSNGAGGGFVLDTDSTMEIADLELRENAAYSFGGGVVDDSWANLSHVRALGNTATYVGGLGVRDYGYLFLTNAVLAGNVGTSSGSGSTHYGATLTAYNQSSLSVSFSTLVGTGGTYAVSALSSSYFNLDNSIVAYNNGYGLELSGVTYGYLSGGYNAFYANSGNLYYNDTARSRIEGTGMVESDPTFVDYSGSPTTDDLHLQSWSPCVDAGNPHYTDPDGSRADMGAYGGNGGEW